MPLHRLGIYGHYLTELFTETFNNRLSYFLQGTNIYVVTRTVSLYSGLPNSEDILWNTLGLHAVVNSLKHMLTLRPHQ